MSDYVFQLTSSVQQYDWGKIGKASKVAQLAQAGGVEVNEDEPYAELWMGTHPTAPSKLAGSSTDLRAHLTANPSLLGDKVIERFKAQKGDVPFLFKVLSIQKALSIQTHPDKATAEKLHAEQPHIYKDDNHKPEMAIALTPFTALCGFRPFPEIETFFRSTPELSALVPLAIANRFHAVSNSSSPEGPEEKAALKDVFAAVMTAHPVEIANELRKLVTRYSAKETKGEVEQLVLTLNEQFPDDVGIFCAFLLNYVKLNPGEAIFLGAGEPHAYVTGDIMECMATSDNVIRAGLTPKLRDIPNLVSGLTYTSGSPDRHLVSPQKFGSRSTLYDPPIPEFSVARIGLQGEETDEQRAVDGPSIVSVVAGSGEIKTDAGEKVAIKAGDVVFMGAGQGASFTSGSDKLEAYRAFVEA